jgi:hypothetical protein
MVCIPLGELVGKVNIQVREDEVVIFDCEPADITRWLFKNLGVKNYRVFWEGYDCLSVKELKPEHLEWFMLRWG